MTHDTLLKILDLARWAPSGDNTQPWRFEIIAADHVAIHGFDTREHVLYDFEGHPSHMAHGALLETLRIAASGFQLDAVWAVRLGSPEDAPVYDVRLREAPGMEVDSLLPYIERRVVQRRPMRMTPLTDSQRQNIEHAAGPNYVVQFFERPVVRFRVARLLWANAYIRLTCPEAFHVHREIIEWGARFSDDRLPEGAIGVDPITARLMRWVMGSWGRVEFFNRYLMGTVAPRLQLDLVPAVACAAHLLLRPRKPLSSLSDYVEAGVTMQRIWLTVTANNLHLQPEMTPVIFRWYAQAGRDLSAKTAINAKVRLLASDFEALAGASTEDPFVFFCRVGLSPVPKSRSLRKNLSRLLVRE